MESHATPVPENSSKSMAEASSMETAVEGGASLVSSRPESILQRKLQSMANQSKMVQRLSMFQRKANLAPARPAPSFSPSVAQFVPAYKSITGTAHLVGLNAEGTIEEEENVLGDVAAGDVVQVDTEVSVTVASESADVAESVWVKVLKKNGKPTDGNGYVKAGVLEDYDAEESIITNMKDMAAMEKMTWDGSGAPEFAAWMADEEQDDDPTTANCWNAILFAAYKAKVIDKAYIRRANVGGRDPLGPQLAAKIVSGAAGTMLRNADETPEAFEARVAAHPPEIPRGMVVVLHSKAFHVVLSLGGGQMYELDNQGMHLVEDPNYNPNYGQEKGKWGREIAALERKAKIKPESFAEPLAAKKAAYEVWLATNSNKDKFSKRLDNEMREVSLTPGLSKYLKMVNLDGIYWGPLPDL